MNFITYDGIKLRDHDVIYNNTDKSRIVAKETFYVGQEMTEKVKLNEEIAKNLSYITIGWYDEFKDAIIEKY